MSKRGVMNNIFLWCLCLSLGTILFIGGIAIFFKNRKNREIAFAKMSVLEIFAAWILIFPEMLSRETQFSFLGVLKSILVSLLDVLNIFSGNGFYDISIKSGYILSNIYSIILSLVNLSVMISLIGFVLQFVGDIIEKIIFERKKYQKVYLFSGLNEKTLSIANSIKSNFGKNDAIVFIDLNPSSVNRKIAKNLGAFYWSDSFKGGIKKIINRVDYLDIFIFGKTEEENLAGLNDFSSLEFKSQTALTRVYVELINTPWNIYGNFVENNKLPKEKVIVNLVHSDENFILNDLYDYSVFENARYDKKTKKSIIDVLIVGSENKSFEMIKTLLHLCQMPGYKLKITVLDKASGKASLKQKIPEIKDSNNTLGESIYSVKYIENINYSSLAFEEAIKNNCPQFYFAFVCTDSEITNIDLGLRINTLRYRENNGKDYAIQICVDNTHIIENWTSEIRRNIQLVGGIENIYNYNFITMSNIERASQAIHEIRQEDKKIVAENQNKEYQVVSWTDYSNDEFKRHSVFARTLSLKYKIQTMRKMGLELNVAQTDTEWKTYEHMRWNMYTRTMGYINSSNTTVEFADLNENEKMITKIHSCLVPFNELTPETQEKDSIIITEDIAKVFEEI